MQQPQSMSLTNWGLLLLLSVLWGSSFFLVGVTVRALPPLTIVLARVAMAALILLPVFYYYGHKLPVTFAAWLPFIGMGVFNNVIPFSLLFFAQTHLTVGLTSIINAMTPLFTVIVMASFGEENLTLNRVSGILLGIVGVAIIQGFDGSLEWDQTFGIGLAMAASLSYGVSALWARRRMVGIPPLKSATCQLISSSLIMIVVVAMVDQPWTLAAPTMEIWLALIGIGLFGTAIAYIVFYRIISTAGASNVMLVTLLVPITALFLGTTFLTEPVHSRELIGAALIGLGLLFIDGRIFRVFKRQE